MDTIGRVTFGGQLAHAFTAHPKADPATGELCFFGYSVERAPYCWYSCADAEGNLTVKNHPVPLPAPVMMHGAPRGRGGRGGRVIWRVLGFGIGELLGLEGMAGV